MNVPFYCDYSPRAPRVSSTVLNSYIIPLIDTQQAQVPAVTITIKLKETEAEAGGVPFPGHTPCEGQSQEFFGIKI